LNNISSQFINVDENLLCLVFEREYRGLDGKICCSNTTGFINVEEDLLYLVFERFNLDLI
jgi:hypothetical protein